jgi:acyl carrier protein
MTSPNDEQIDSVILSFLHRRVPDLDTADLARPMYDLDVDSLDVVDLTHELETTFAVKADLDRVSECVTFLEYRAYIRELIDAA